MPEVWDSWVPGVLSKRQLKAVHKAGFIKHASSGGFDHSALDLHLSSDAFELKGGSVKPFGSDYFGQITSDRLLNPLVADQNGHFLLRPRRTYLFRLKESIEAKCTKSIWGRATAKSSIGRLDVLVRLIVDGTRRYEGFDPEELGEGSTSMFVEVTPITFPVVVKAGIALNQLRLFYGDPADCELKGHEISRTCLTQLAKDHHLSVNLAPVDIVGVPGCGFRATSPNRFGAPIRLWSGGNGELNPGKWWELVGANQQRRLKIQKGSFYILRSKERLRLPAGIAVYARAIDEEIGEMRIHYAGFAHPFFGQDREDGQLGTPLVFEVRGHDVDVNLRDGEILARLQFFRMSEEAKKERKNPARSVSKKKDPYNDQDLQLSKFFAKWKSRPKLVQQGK
ncbi:MAG TPA: 2'-deoxycytidine 5'-triphosphate deaminase [Gemmatimonadaceae bacterium]|nr:2'-deoxycytidine 5'-triphosphate deaminase [Gemmatimonadaceae bacterium]